jgi:hypothetical protein
MCTDTSADDYYETNYACQEILSLIAYKPPRRDESCRVCNSLDGNGDTHQLYENHVHSFPTGCPRYVSMTVSQRLQIAVDAKLCLLCHDPEYTFKPNDKEHISKCQIQVRGKSRYTYQVTNCQTHMWVCSRHKNENNQGLNKFKEEFSRKYGLNLGLVVSIPNIGLATANSDAQNNPRDARERAFDEQNRYEAVRVADKPVEAESIVRSKKCERSGVNNAAQMKEVQQNLQSPEPVPTHEHKSLIIWTGYEEA